MKEEKRITEIMNSLEGIQPVKAPPNGFVKIKQKLADQELQQPITQQSSYGWVRVAAVIALVICSNLWAVTNYLSDEGTLITEPDSYPQLVSDFNMFENE